MIKKKKLTFFATIDKNWSNFKDIKILQLYPVSESGCKINPKLTPTGIIGGKKYPK